MNKLIVFALLLSGCAAKSSMKPVAQNQELFPRHSEPVCFLKSPLPTEITYTKIGEIRGSKKTYGSLTEVLPLMAEEARSVGADAIINLETGHKIGAFAWARPVGKGIN